MVWSDESDREWLTEEECARRLGCSLTRVRELVERNVLRARYNCYGGIEVECAVVTGRMRACPPSETIGPRVDERGAAEASAASAENRCGPRPTQRLPSRPQHPHGKTGRGLLWRWHTARVLMGTTAHRPRYAPAQASYLSNRAIAS